MGTIQGTQAALNYCRSNRVCGNCRYETREPVPGSDRTRRVCGKHGWLVLMSSSCDGHGYRDPAVRDQESADAAR